MLNWIEKRTGFISLTKQLLTEDIPGGPKYWYVFGSATLFAMTIQIVTGIFLTFFYAPSAATAWESTRAIYLNPFQHFILSVHYWGASAMIALLFLHMLQVVIFGAYKSPREVQWMVGVALLLTTLVLGLTGYLLPWDMNAYFASQVSINMTLNAPIFGTFVQQLAQGGTTMGTLTINRFFGLHVWLMPAALVALVGAHLFIFRHNGPAGPPVEDPRTLKTGRFWPDQLFMDTVAIFFVFVVIVVLALVFPPFLDAKADPTKFFVPYPAWYFLDLFGLVNLIPGQFEIVAAIIIPGIATTLLFVFPWMDRSISRTFGSRRFVLGLVTVSMIVILSLTVWSQISIMKKQSDAMGSGQMTQSSEATILGTQPAAASTPAAAGPSNHGATVYQTNCSSCHGANGQGQPGAIPPLADNPFVTGDPHKVIGVVLGGLTTPIQVSGTTYHGTMPPWKGTLSNNDIADVITYIRSSLGKNKAGAVKASDVSGYKR
jgi:quinol-cytochrome oxidoreductase complex cytochrome b subunit